MFHLVYIGIGENDNGFTFQLKENGNLKTPTAISVTSDRHKSFPGFNTADEIILNFPGCPPITINRNSNMVTPQPITGSPGYPSKPYKIMWSEDCELVVIMDSDIGSTSELFAAFFGSDNK